MSTLPILFMRLRGKTQKIIHTIQVLLQQKMRQGGQKCIHITDKVMQARYNMTIAGLSPAIVIYQPNSFVILHR